MLQNVVATSSLRVSLDLQELSRKMKNSEYNPRVRNISPYVPSTRPQQPKRIAAPSSLPPLPPPLPPSLPPSLPQRFGAVIVRDRDPKATALIFHTGNMVCTGTRSEEDARLASKKFAKAVKLAQPERNVKFKDFKIQNMVGSVNMGFPIRLEGLGMAHRGFTNYEPELFPGLVYRLFSPKVVLLIFVSGRVVLTGGKSTDDILGAFHQIKPVLREFAKKRAGDDAPALTSGGGGKQLTSGKGG